MHAEFAIDQDMGDAGGITSWVAGGGVIGDIGFVKNTNIRMISGFKPASIFQPQAVGGNRCNLSQPFAQAQDIAVSNIILQEPCGPTIAAKGADMVFKDAFIGDGDGI